MAEKVLKVGLEMENDHIYWIDKDGDISCVKAARGRKKQGKAKKAAKCGIKKDNKKFIYFVKKGDIYQAKRVNS
ncbi:MAG: hypothetical protein HN833_03815 [Elusimicrobiaceae bacterium]|jgi:hypothetical protein|nr:hypothetical protein [Elusimicrobiaceae bacterium]MBT3955592.1 hypothetical protein [Elusimicrobiaceae bacterium]MBT4008645.1 hypothetical protein [Elusimicrobiaceae bacterium]MBT4402747.1 hypothetical protein [Elusimicrobiaceae bacterium]MBT4439618.1 hypothetical protein [Elusimicrobiaceae bacterium]